MCRRHVRIGETCPFCRAAGLFAIAVLATACNRPPEPDAQKDVPVTAPVAKSADIDASSTADAITTAPASPDAQPASARSPKDLEVVVAIHRRHINKCAEEVPGTAGKVTFDIEIAPNGSVSKVSHSPTTLDPKVVTCATAAIQRMKFPPASGTDKFSFPVIYAKSE